MTSLTTVAILCKDVQLLQ